MRVHKDEDSKGYRLKKMVGSGCFFIFFSSFLQDGYLQNQVVCHAQDLFPSNLTVKLEGRAKGRH